jgi:hypothetical protein
MERREALRNVALIMGGAISATTMGVLFDSCSPVKRTGALFTAQQESMLAELAEVIIPQTTTPGAKAAGVGPFIKMMLEECYPEEAQNVFVKGLDVVENLAQSKFNLSFDKTSAQQRAIIMKQITDETAPMIADEKKAIDAITDKNKKPIAKPYFFVILKDLTLLGYFSSEAGATKALEYVAVPGKYDGNVDLKPGQKAWAL